MNNSEIPKYYAEDENGKVIASAYTLRGIQATIAKARWTLLDCLHNGAGGVTYKVKNSGVD